MPTKDLERIVETATKELTGYEKEEKVQIVDRVLNLLQSKVTLSDLQAHLDIIQRIDCSIPSQITDEITKSNEFSKEIAKKLSSKVTIAELDPFIKKCDECKVITEEMQDLLEIWTKALEWNSKANEIKDSYVTFKQLCSQYNEGSSLPISLPMLERVKQRKQNAQSIINKIYNLSKPAKGRGIKSQEKTPEGEIYKLIAEAERIKLTNSDVQKAQEHLHIIDHWKDRVYMLFEDANMPLNYAIYAALKKEAEAFKYKVALVDKLKERISQIEWEIRADECMKSDNVKVQSLNKLIDEGNKSNFSSDTIIRLGQMIGEIEAHKKAAKAALDKPSTITELKEVKMQVEQCSDAKDQREEIDKKLIYIEQWKKKCEMIQNHSMNFQVTFKDVTDLIKEGESYNVTFVELKQFKEWSEPLMKWVKQAQKFLLKFKKEDKIADEGQCDVPMNNKRLERSPCLFKQLESLIETPNNIVKSTPQYEQILALISTASQWDNRATKVLEQAKNGNRSQQDVEDILIKSLLIPFKKEKIAQLLEYLNLIKWLAKANSIFTSKPKYHILEQVVKDGQTMLEIMLPTEKEMHNKLNEQYSTAKKWITNYRQSIQELKKDDKKLTLNYIEEIIKEAEKITVSLTELENLRSLQQEAIAWTSNARKLLNSRATYQQLEDLIKEAEDFWISIDEIELVNSMKIVCDKWKHIAQQVIKSRPIEHYVNEHQCIEEESTQAAKSVSIILIAQPNGYSIDNIIIENELHPILYSDLKDSEKELKRQMKIEREKFKKRGHIEEDQDYEQRYCICRGKCDKCLMVCCDLCNEWFHCDCLNLSQEIVHSYQHFICIGCSKQKELAFTYKGNWSEIKRVSYKEFEMLINYGKSIPIELTELAILNKVYAKIKVWKALAQKEIERGDDMLSLYKYYSSPQQGCNYSEEIRLSRKRDITLHQLYLESESFPAELDEAKELLTLLKRRDWMVDSIKALKNVKQTKNIKKLYTACEKLGIMESAPVVKLLVVLRNILHSTSKENSIEEFIKENIYSQNPVANGAFNNLLENEKVLV